MERILDLFLAGRGAMKDRDYLRAPEAANLLRLSCSTLAKMRMRGDGPPFTKAGRTVLYARADLVAWVERQKVGAAAPAPGATAAKLARGVATGRERLSASPRRQE